MGDTGAHLSTPLVSCLVSDMLQQSDYATVMHSCTASDFTNVEFGRTVNTLLHDAGDFIVKWNQILFGIIQWLMA